MGGSEILAAAGVIISTLSSVVAALYRVSAKAKDDQIKSFKETIEYEREQKEAEQTYGKRIASDTFDTMKDLINLVESIPPAMIVDGDKTRTKLGESTGKVLQKIIEHRGPS